MTVELLTVSDVARLTGLSAYTVRAAVRDGDLAASKLRGRIRVHPDALATWVDESRVKPPAADLILGAFPPPRRATSVPDGGYRQAARDRRRAA